MINKTYIINLVRRPDKKSKMNKQIVNLKKNNIDLNAIFFEGVDGSNVDELAKYQFRIPDWTDPHNGKIMTNGEIGCALSHYLVWTDIIEQVDKNILPQNSLILVLEDDIIIPVDFMNKLKSYLDEINQSFDMLYIHRKPLDFNNEEQISLHLNYAKYSYWTSGYILTYDCAKMLLNSGYLNNLIPVDEFLPIMYGCNVYGFEKIYESRKKINCLATVPNLLYLTENAFMDSDTYHSNPCCSNFLYNDTKHLIVYIGPKTGHNYQRLTNCCQIYGIHFVAMNYDNLFDNISSFFKIGRSDNLVTMIIIKPDDDCHIIPISPSKNFITSYAELTTKNEIVISSNMNRKLLFCLPAMELLNIIDDIGKNAGIDILCQYLQSNDNIIVDTNGKIFCHIDESNKLNCQNCQIESTNIRPCTIFATDMKNIVHLNRAENYAGNNFYEYVQEKIENLPKVYLSIHIDKNTDAMRIVDILDYPKNLLTVKIFKLIDYTEVEHIYMADIEHFFRSECDYYFNIGINCIIDNPNTLKNLIFLKKDFVCPMILRRSDNWSNFWGDINGYGYYQRSFDYMDIVYGKKRGCWNVPYVTGVYLIKDKIIKNYPSFLTDNNYLDLDMRICHNFRNTNIHMYVSNLENYGYIIEENCISFDEITLYHLETHRIEWESKYLHPIFYKYKNNPTNMQYDEICADIYNFPLFSEFFCRDLIQLAEKYGNWSAGKNNHRDSRMGLNYYENYPTVDIQLFELKLEKIWNQIVFNYIAPMTKILYNNYKTKDINLAFIVKYTANNQSSLDAHHDASTYTVNIALNSNNDYQGGGCRFIRQNYILKDQPVGMCCMHPGRLTAYHEGLPVSNGTRYILVSFIN